jgi:N-methylhydantoinase A
MTSAQRAIADLARRLGLAERDAAEGVLAVLNNNMASAIRSRTVQKGIDPRTFSLVAFGGAGPLHGADVAAILGMREVVVPPHPGITSAVGLLTTDLKYDAVRTEFQVSDHLDRARLNRDLAEMERTLAAQFATDGVDAAAVSFVRGADVRYVGQGYELRVPVPAGEIDGAALDAIFAAFHAQHEAEYGHAFPKSAIEIVNVRVTGVGRMPKIGRPSVPHGGSFRESLIRRGPCAFRVGGKLETPETAFYRRDRLPLEQPFSGPAIVLQMDSTTVVPPGWRAVADSNGNLILNAGA